MTASTFSSFSLDTVALVESSRFVEAGVSVVGSLLLGLGGILQSQIPASDHYWYTTALNWFFIWILYILFR